MSKLPISIIVAVAENGVIGRAGGMPWRLSGDLKRFKSITMGNPLIMGRKTFQSIGKALPGRHSIVISRDRSFGFDQVEVVASVDAALLAGQKWGNANGSKEICILGGGEIYQRFLPLAERIYLTEVLAAPDGDTYFPEIDKLIWSVQHSEDIPAGSNDDQKTRFIIYHRG